MHPIAPQSTILVWAHDPAIAAELALHVDEPGRAVHLLEDDAQLAASGSSGRLLVAQAGPRLEAQRMFLGGPLVLVDPVRISSTELAGRAYAVVANPPEAGLAVDRFLTHRRLADQAASHRGPPRYCSRCGRGFDSLKARRLAEASHHVEKEIRVRWIVPNGRVFSEQVCGANVVDVRVVGIG